MFVHAELAEGVNTHVDHAAEGLAVNPGHAEPQDLRGMLAARGAGQDFEVRKFALDARDDLERFRFIIDRKDESFALWAPAASNRSTREASP